MDLKEIDGLTVMKPKETDKATAMELEKIGMAVRSS